MTRIPLIGRASVIGRLVDTGLAKRPKTLRGQAVETCISAIYDAVQ
ncbi:hypothetical protein DmGdi_21570 [Gluconobacter sp. Gdi]|nr:hypothetical protein DmGdi_21570 [Gluconobacter sp. Gdi]